MSDYTRTTNFTAKDALPTGDPDKIVKGEEIQDELDAVATAVATKLDSSEMTTHQTGHMEILDRSTGTVTAGATETTLYSYTVTANTMGTDRLLRFKVVGDFLNSDGTSISMTIKVKFGGVTVGIYTDDFFNQGADADRGLIYLTGFIANKGDAATQLSMSELIWDYDRNVVTSDSNDIGTGSTDTATRHDHAFDFALSVDTTSNQDLVVTGLISTGTDTEFRKLYAVVTLE